MVIRNPRSFYEAKRGWAALKMKTYTDSEATVKRVVDDFNMEVEMDGKVLAVHKVAITAQDAKPGNKVLLRYSRKSEATQLPINPIAMRIVSSV